MYRIIALISLIFISCSGNGEYFYFDEIDHYSISIDDQEITELYNKPSKSEFDSLKVELITGYTPATIADSSFIDKLEILGYKKTAVNTARFNIIKEIFKEKSNTLDVSSLCETTYRNILIFKNKNKIVGTAKICFDCMKSDIKGTTANTDNFGQNGDYEKLEQILVNSIENNK